VFAVVASMYMSLYVVVAEILECECDWLSNTGLTLPVVSATFKCTWHLSPYGVLLASCWRVERTALTTTHTYLHVGPKLPKSELLVFQSEVFSADE